MGGGAAWCRVEVESRAWPGLLHLGVLGSSTGLSSVTPEKSRGPQICPSPGRPHQPRLASEMEV